MRKFIALNVSLSGKFEKVFSFNSDDAILLRKFCETFGSDIRVADVGGGKKPAKNIVGAELPSEITYDGYDISLDELQIAKEHYSDIFQLDLTDESSTPQKQYDAVICLNTLEHVRDVSSSIQTLSHMVADGGKLYLKLPSRYALFAQLNLLLPNDLKKKILHKVFPHKSGDGFPAYYDKSTPNRIVEICKENNLQLVEKNLVKWSSYFSFFLPLYVMWRLLTLMQNLLISDYCESFEVTFVKKGA